MRTALVAFAILPAFAQQLEFEVASVKPAINAPFGGGLPNSAQLAEILGFEGGPGSKTPGRIHYTGVTLKMLLARAYAVRPYQISGPGWMETERYDIEARYPVETNPEEFRLMLQKLLADRFRMVLHRETREMSRYRLVTAKGGPKLSPPQTPPAYKDEAERKAAMEKEVKARMQAMMNRPHSGPYRHMGHANGTMTKLAESLSGYVDLPVTDDTGLEGTYSWSLEWSPGESADLPSIFVALQEQLGLKLESAKGPVEFLVVERAEKTPAPN